MSPASNPESPLLDAEAMAQRSRLPHSQAETVIHVPIADVPGRYQHAWECSQDAYCRAAFSCSTGINAELDADIGLTNDACLGSFSADAIVNHTKQLPPNRTFLNISFQSIAPYRIAEQHQGKFRQTHSNETLTTNKGASFKLIQCRILPVLSAFHRRLQCQTILS